MTNENKSFVGTDHAPASDHHHTARMGPVRGSTILLYLMGMLCFVGSSFSTSMFSSAFVFMLWAFITVFACLLYLFKIEERKLEDAMVTLVGIFYVVFFCYHLALLGMEEFLGLTVWLVVITAFGTDICAYFAGVTMGKHKLCPVISPKKTWEGFFWGWFFGALICALFGLGTAFFGSPMLPFLDLEHWYWIVGLALLIPLLGDLGDLAFSLIKRHFNIKDYGNILRGHGGVLDRADSSIFAMIGVSIALIFISHGFNFLL